MEYELKKDYLTREEVKTMLIVALQNFQQEGNIEGYLYDYFSMEDSFFDALGLFCIKDFNDEIRENLYNKGLFNELLDKVTNAKHAYDTMYLIANKMSSIDNIVGTLVKTVIKNVPDEKSMKKLLKNWDKITKEYNEIMNEGDK